MKHSFPLSAQILVVFVSNIIVIHLIFVVLSSSQLKLGWDEILLEPVSDRVQFICMMLHLQLVDLPKEEWNRVLDEYGKEYGVNLYLFGNSGQQIAGSSIVLPAKVSSQLQARMQFFKNGPLSFKNGPLPANGPVMPKPLNGGKISAPPFGQSLLPFPRFVRPPGRFLLHTDDPGMFWIGAPIPLSKREKGFDQMGFLCAATPNLFQTKLMNDFVPILIVAAGIFGVSLIIWWPFIYFTTASINRLTSTTEKIADGKFDIRLDVKQNDELGRLGLAINTLASRLSLFVSGQRRFLGDIAHELCSPIARLQIATAILEQNLQSDLTGTLCDIKEEVEQMSNLVNELLAFSKAGIQGKEIAVVDIDLEALLFRLIAKQQSTKLTLRVSPGLHCMGDEMLLERAFSNVLRNAERYAVGATEILIEAFRKDSSIVVRIADDGPGVPPETIALLGEPFYRPESSRNRESGGVGLGLAIVRTCVEACNGTIRIQNIDPHGLEVTILLCSAL